MASASISSSGMASTSAEVWSEGSFSNASAGHGSPSASWASWMTTAETAEYNALGIQQRALYLRAFEAGTRRL